MFRCQRCLAFGIALGLLGTAGPAHAGKEMDNLHQVLRQFKVAYVERVNLSGMLLGAVQGLKEAAPGLRVEVLGHPRILRFEGGGESLEIDATAARDFDALERAIVAATDLAMRHELVGASAIARLEGLVIRRMVAHCGDPWSAYLDAELYKRLLEDGTGASGSAGLLFEIHQGSLHLLDVVEDGPAARAGLHPGDVVESLAGRPGQDLNELEALALVRGPVGERVEVRVAGKAVELELAPEPKRNIEVNPLEGGIAHVRILNFMPGTADRMTSVLTKLGSHYNGKLGGLVLDLRGNPGGLVTEGTALVGLFLAAGPVVSIISKDHVKVEVERNPTPGAYRALPLALVVDGRSASVSEIVALALRDYGRARLFGSKTQGKGTVQVVIEMPNGGALKLSTGRYYSPHGTPLYEGIEPDFAVEWNGTGPDLPLRRAVDSFGH